MAPLTSVLIVDDEPAVLDLMSRWVTSLGLRAQTASNATEALASLQRQHYDLAVIDVMMPGHDGLWLANEMQREHPQTAVIVSTAYTELLSRDSQHTPIADFLIKPFKRERFALAVDRGRQWRELALEEVHRHAMLSLELRDRTGQLVQAVHQRVAAGASETDALATLCLERMPEVAAHGERVSRYAHAVARQLDVERALRPELEIAARFHDVGKLAIPEALITKPSPLTRGEAAIMRRHVDIGAEILESTQSLSSAASVRRTPSPRSCAAAPSSSTRRSSPPSSPSSAATRSAIPGQPRPTNGHFCPSMRCLCIHVTLGDRMTYSSREQWRVVCPYESAIVFSKLSV